MVAAVIGKAGQGELPAYQAFSLLVELAGILTVIALGWRAGQLFSWDTEINDISSASALKGQRRAWTFTDVLCIGTNIGSEDP